MRAARVRAGWSRETLAHHSGVSWSAIAQIESGRRKDVRLSSLAALAEALGVSVDYLIGSNATLCPQLLKHRVLVYESDEDFLETTVPFLGEGIELDQSLLAVATSGQADLLRHALGDRARQVDFADATDWYDSPNGALTRYRYYFGEKLDAGATWIRVVGQPDWKCPTDAETTAWIRYESMVNLICAPWPVTFTCAYDVRTLPAKLISDARRTHPELVDGVDTTLSPGYASPEDFLIES